MAKLTVFALAIVLSLVCLRVPEWGWALAVWAFFSCMTVGMLIAAIYDAFVRRQKRKTRDRVLYRQMVARATRRPPESHTQVQVLILNSFGQQAQEETVVTLPPEVEYEETK